MELFRQNENNTRQKHGNAEINKEKKDKYVGVSK